MGERGGELRIRKGATAAVVVGPKGVFEMSFVLLFFPTTFRYPVFFSF